MLRVISTLETRAFLPATMMPPPAISKNFEYSMRTWVICCASLLGSRSMPAPGRVPRDVLEGRVEDQQPVRVDHRQALAPVSIGCDAAEANVFGLLHVETVAPHFFRAQIVMFFARSSIRMPMPHSPNLPRCSLRSPSSVPPVTQTFDTPEMVRIA